MENHIKDLRIENFKSIKELDIQAKRINVFIGKPNVGKSNILEAISLLGASFEKDSSKYLSSFIRYENFYNLYLDNDLTKIIKVIADKDFAVIQYNLDNRNTHNFITGVDKNLINNYLKEKQYINIHDYFHHYHNDLDPKELKGIKMPNVQIINSDSSLGTDLSNEISNVRKYDFKKLTKDINRFPLFLLPPFGKNLFTILQSNREFYKELVPIFEEYGLKLVLRIHESQFEIQKELDAIVYSYPYSTIADTLQRIIFYFAAIESNKNAVLIFEEPEAHSYPPYTKMLGDRICQSETNQFFITTHSPYLLQTLIANTNSDNLNVFVTYFEDYQTKVKLLNDDELAEIQEDSTDVFYRLDNYLENVG